MNLKEINDSYTRDLYFEASRYSEYMNEVYLEEHKRLGVEWMALSHGHILLNLFSEGELTMTEITNHIKRKAPTTTVLVKRLKKEGFVSSRMSSEDSRISLIYLTDKGREFCGKMETYLSHFCQAAEAVLTEEEVDTVVRIFAKVRANIELELRKY